MKKSVRFEKELGGEGTWKGDGRHCKCGKWQASEVVQWLAPAVSFALTL